MDIGLEPKRRFCGRSQTAWLGEYDLFVCFMCGMWQILFWMLFFHNFQGFGACTSMLFQQSEVWAGQVNLQADWQTS